MTKPGLPGFIKSLKDIWAVITFAASLPWLEKLLGFIPLPQGSEAIARFLISVICGSIVIYAYSEYRRGRNVLMASGCLIYAFLLFGGAMLMVLMLGPKIHFQSNAFMALLILFISSVSLTIIVCALTVHYLRSKEN
jgi:hypothetical protein